MRSFSVLKDEMRFKIAIKPSSKRKSSQKAYNIRGYLSERFAREDIPRLIEHLKLKRVQTFEKCVGEEYHVTPPSKKRRKEVICVTPAAKELRGSCLKQLQRRLNYSYYRYKTQQPQTLEPLLSKKDWMRLQPGPDKEGLQSVEATDIFDLQQDVRVETSLSNLYQRLQLLETRMKTSNKIMSGLRDVLFSGTCYKRLRESVTEEEKQDDIIDLTEDDHVFTQENTSKAQLVRITAQCFVTYNMFLKLESRDEKEIGMIKEVLQEARQESGSNGSRQRISLLLARYDSARTAFRIDNSISSISDEVRRQSGGLISSKTIRVWYHEYIEKESFMEDRRGSHARTNFIDEHGYTQRFQLYLKNERKLTVDVATRALEAIITNDPPASEDGRRLYDDLRPFSRRTVHRWMLKLGCKYEKATVSYYTDTHEAEETKRDFIERYDMTLCNTFKHLHDSSNHIIFVHLGTDRLNCSSL